jgi:hypothetical protein
MRTSWAAVLFVGLVIQTVPPLPGQAAASPQNSSGNVQDQSRNKQKAAAPSFPAYELHTAPNSNGGKVAPKDTEYNVKLTGTPVVAIADKAKTVWDYVFDWGPWLFNAFLVWVGVAAVFVAHRTRVSIDRQADLMDRQALMKQQADLMVVQTSILKANTTQWIDLLPNGIDVTTDSKLTPPDVITINLRWRIVNNTSLPFTVRLVRASICRDLDWDVFEFIPDDIVSPHREIGRGNF